MKKIVVSFLIVFGLWSCQQKNETSKYPLNLIKVLTKHGGLKNWNSMKTVSFNIGDEVHTVDLQSRKTAINTSKYSLGYNGDNVWLDQDSTYFKGNKDFYHNLYFYFYAMPFVLADDGISYTEVSPLKFNNVLYPGYKISFNDGVGASAKDNYYIYYNPTTYNMEWLGYTSTYFSKEVSNKVNFIKYNKWENVSGFTLPLEIVWYQKDKEGNLTTPASNPVVFSLPLLTKASLADSFYENPKKH